MLHDNEKTMVVVRLCLVNQLETAIRIGVVGHDVDGVAIGVYAILPCFIDPCLSGKTRGAPEIVIGVGIEEKTILLTDIIIVDQNGANLKAEIVVE